jgi:hypothetical protein
MTNDVKEAICDWISVGNSLASFCREHSVGYSTVTKELRGDPEFVANYTRARIDAGDADADQVTDLKERLLRGEISPEQARVAIDACKWSAGKRQPKKYGDKLDVSHEGTLDVKIVVGGDAGS